MHADKLLLQAQEQLQQLQKIMEQAAQAENLLSHNIDNPLPDKTTKGERVSDAVAKFGGSWVFIISFLALLIIWILFNTLSSTNHRFDAYPYILLNLILSCVAALQAPIIMMSQNRQEQKDRQRNENDYQINLKAELEIRTLHQKINLLLQNQLNTLTLAQAEQLQLLQTLTQQQAKTNQP